MNINVREIISICFISLHIVLCIPLIVYLITKTRRARLPDARPYNELIFFEFGQICCVTTLLLIQLKLDIQAFYMFGSSIAISSLLIFNNKFIGLTNHLTPVYPFWTFRYQHKVVRKYKFIKLQVIIAMVPLAFSVVSLVNYFVQFMNDLTDLIFECLFDVISVYFGILLLISLVRYRKTISGHTNISLIVAILSSLFFADILITHIYYWIIHILKYIKIINNIELFDDIIGYYGLAIAFTENILITILLVQLDLFEKPLNERVYQLISRI